MDSYVEPCVFFEDGGNALRIKSGGYLKIGSADLISTALYGGGGNATTKVSTAVADREFLHFRWESTATSGDCRGIYNRLHINGIGGGGEAMRNYTTVEKAAATARGAHTSIGFGSSAGSVSGLAAAEVHTLEIPNRALAAAGSYYGAVSEIYGVGSSGSLAAVTASAIHHFCLSGDATACATVAHALSFAGLISGTNAAAHLKTDMHTGTPTDGLKVSINGATYYISLVAA